MSEAMAQFASLSIENPMCKLQTRKTFDGRSKSGFEMFVRWGGDPVFHNNVFTSPPCECQETNDQCVFEEIGTQVGREPKLYGVRRAVRDLLQQEFGLNERLLPEQIKLDRTTRSL
jgi:hypothetical protein